MLRFLTIFRNSITALILIIHFWKLGLRVIFSKVSLSKRDNSLFFSWHNTWSLTQVVHEIVTTLEKISKPVRTSCKVQCSLEGCFHYISSCCKQEVTVISWGFLLHFLWLFCAKVQINLHLYSNVYIFIQIKTLCDNLYEWKILYFWGESRIKLSSSSILQSLVLESCGLS